MLLRKHTRAIFQNTEVIFKRFSNFSTQQFREESDSFGPIKVPKDKYWGAQTQRSIQNFDIARDTDQMPLG